MKKRVLNISSRKKRDDMQPFSDITPANRQSGTFTNSGADFTADGDRNPVQMLWAATGRTAESTPGVNGTITELATRTAKTCFIRGLKENIRVETNDGSPWQWRRIVFRLKGTRFLDAGAENIPDRDIYASNGTDGYARLLTDWFGTTAASTVNGILFKGVEGDDWPFTGILEAHVDTSRVSLMYDRTVRIAAGNESGVSRSYRRWHHVNKNLVYNDDEAGSTETFSHLSTESKAGCGDVYVMDIIVPSTFAETTSRITFTPQSTLYWHER